MSETAKVNCGGTKKKSNAATDSDRREDRRAAPVAACHEHDAEQIDHDEIRELEIADMSARRSVHSAGDCRRATA